LTDQHTRHEEREPDVSVDSLFDGKMVCRQPRQGYRFSLDSILLAHFSPVHNGDSILDMGCGCGIVGLIMMFRWQTLLKELVGLEIQTELAELAGKNGRLNGFDKKYKIVEGDLCTIKASFPAESFSRVVCNPPFYTSGSGRESTDRQSLIARHQVCSSTDQVMAAASWVVKNRGSVCVVFPADRLVELVGSMVTAHLQPKRMQMVYSYPGKKGTARLVLIEAIKNGGPGVTILPPFCIYQKKNGAYTNEMQRLYDGHWEEQGITPENEDHIMNTM
jgi:tRNA1Val (adenine37-N6)-methyltransferase